MYKPLGDILMVEYVDEAPPVTSVVLPDNGGSTMRSFKVLEVGDDVGNIRKGQTVRGEDMSQPVERSGKLRIINKKFIHLIHE